VEERGGAPRLLPAAEPGEDDAAQADLLPDGVQVPVQREDGVPDKGHRGAQAGPLATPSHIQTDLLLKNRDSSARLK